MLMTFVLTISMQSIGTLSQTTITVFQTLFLTVFQIPDNSQQIDFVVSDNNTNNNNSNDNDALSNMTFTDINDILTEVRKNKHKEYISYISTGHSKTPSVLSTIELEVSNKINNPVSNTDAEEWKPGTLLKVGDSMIAGPREAKL